MRVVIVGGSSSLGQALVPLLSRGAEVITAGRKGCDIPLDLADASQRIRLPAAVDVVVNAAAAFGGPRSEDYLETANINVAGVLRLAQACADASVTRFVMISSIYAQPGAHAASHGIYGLSKRHADELASDYCARFDVPLTVIRPSSFYGPEPWQQRHHPFLTRFIEQAARGEDISIYGGHDAVRNFIHVDDVANVVARAIRAGITGTHVCMHPDNVSYSQIAAAAIAAFASGSTVRFLPDKPDIPDVVFDTDTALFRLVGYFPQISIAEGMRGAAARRSMAR
jgi:nucleoside-diphosphate-sugar epimerase